jgi:hypothetical protein
MKYNPYGANFYRCISELEEDLKVLSSSVKMISNKQYPSVNDFEVDVDLATIAFFDFTHRIEYLEEVISFMRRMEKQDKKNEEQKEKKIGIPIVKNVEIPVENKSFKPMSQEDIVILSVADDMFVGCKFGCQGKTWPSTLYDEKTKREFKFESNEPVPIQWAKQFSGYARYVDK